MTRLLIASVLLLPVAGCFSVPQLRQCYNRLDCSGDQICTAEGVCVPSSADASLPVDGGGVTGRSDADVGDVADAGGNGDLRCNVTAPIRVNDEDSGVSDDMYDLTSDGTGFAYVVADSSSPRRILFNEFSGFEPPSSIDPVVLSSPTVDSVGPHVTFVASTGSYAVVWTENDTPRRVKLASIPRSSRQVGGVVTPEDIRAGRGIASDILSTGPQFAQTATVAVMWKHDDDCSIRMSLYGADFDLVGSPLTGQIPLEGNPIAAVYPSENVFVFVGVVNNSNTTRIDFSRYERGLGTFTKSFDETLSFSGADQPAVASTARGYSVVWVQTEEDVGTINYRQVGFTGSLTSSVKIEIDSGVELLSAREPSLAYGANDTIGVVWQPVSRGSFGTRFGPHFAVLDAERGGAFLASVVLSTESDAGPPRIAYSDSGFGVLWKQGPFLLFSLVTCTPSG